MRRRAHRVGPWDFDPSLDVLEIRGNAPECPELVRMIETYCPARYGAVRTDVEHQGSRVRCLDDRLHDSTASNIVCAGTREARSVAIRLAFRPPGGRDTIVF